MVNNEADRERIVNGILQLIQKDRAVLQLLDRGPKPRKPTSDNNAVDVFTRIAGTVFNSNLLTHSTFLYSQWRRKTRNWLRTLVMHKLQTCPVFSTTSVVAPTIQLPSTTSAIFSEASTEVNSLDHNGIKEEPHTSEIITVDPAVNTGQQNVSPVTSSVQSAFVADNHLCATVDAVSTGKLMQFTQNGVVRTVVVPIKCAKSNVPATQQRARMRIFRSTRTRQTGHSIVTPSPTTISQSPNVLSTLKRCTSHTNGAGQFGISPVRSVIPIRPKPVASSCTLSSSTQSAKLKTVLNEPTFACNVDLAKRYRGRHQQNLLKQSVAISAAKRRAVNASSRGRVLTVHSSSSLSCVPAESVSSSVNVRPVCRSSLAQNQACTIETMKVSTESLSRHISSYNIGLKPAKSTCGAVKKVTATVGNSASRMDVTAPILPRVRQSPSTPSSSNKLKPIAAARSVTVSQSLKISSASSKDAPYMAQLNSTSVMPVFAQSNGTASSNAMAMASACMNPVVVTSPVIHLQNTGTYFTPVTNVSPSQYGFTNICMQQPQQYYPVTGMTGMSSPPNYNTSPLQLSNCNGPVFVELSADGMVRNRNTASNHPTNVIVIQNSNVFLCSPPQQSSVRPVLNGSVNNIITGTPTAVLPVQSNLSSLAIPHQYQNLPVKVSNQPCVGAVEFSQQVRTQTPNFSQRPLLNAGRQNCSLQQLAVRPPASLQMSIPSIGNQQSMVQKTDNSKAKLVKLPIPYRNKLLNKGLKTLKRCKPSIRSPSIVKKDDSLVQNGVAAVKKQDQTPKLPVRNRSSRNCRLHHHLQEKNILSQTPRAILPRPSQLGLPIFNVAIEDPMSAVEFSKQLITGSNKSLLADVVKKSPSPVKNIHQPEELTSSVVDKFHSEKVTECEKCGSTSSITNEMCQVCQGQNVVINGVGKTASNVNSLNSASGVILNKSNCLSLVPNRKLMSRVVPNTKDRSNDDCMAIASGPSSSVASMASISKYTTITNGMLNVYVRLERLNNVATEISSTVKVQRNRRNDCVRSDVETVNSQQTFMNDCIVISPTGSSDSDGASGVSAVFDSCSKSNSRPSKRLNNYQSSRTKRLMHQNTLRGNLV